MSTANAASLAKGGKDIPLADGCQQIDRVSSRGPAGTTPALERSYESLASSEEKTGEPNNNCWSAYKRVQVRCKQASVDDIVNLPGFVDFSQHHGDERIHRLPNPISSPYQKYYKGEMYGLSVYPGFIFCPGALSEGLQKKLAFRAVTEYCEAPHTTNIDLVPPKSTEEASSETMWNLWKKEQTAETKPPATRKKQYRSFRKLSWATTGYHYDWTKRAYHKDGSQSPMPELLNNVANMFACTALEVEAEESKRDSPLENNAEMHNAHEDDNTTPHPKFTPSASIINYYNLKSTMGGHRDDLEYALDKPVVSISLGLPAIFLLGGTTKEKTPVLPILVRPGDVMLLAGKARLNFHGMARLLSKETMATVTGTTSNNNGSGLLLPSEQIATIGSVTSDSNGNDNNMDIGGSFTFPEEDDEDMLCIFLNKHRININVRQVYKDKNCT